MPHCACQIGAICPIVHVTQDHSRIEDGHLRIDGVLAHPSLRVVTPGACRGTSDAFLSFFTRTDALKPVWHAE
jgi:hypothetical protein